MKRIFEDYDNRSLYFNSFLLIGFLLVVLDVILIAYKFTKGYYIYALDYTGLLGLIMFIFFTFKLVVDYKNKAEYVHNTYMEMITSNGKKKKNK